MMRKAAASRLDILDLVVQLHGETGQPVSSGLVARAMKGALSPASIRTVMLGLEREGRLRQPHTSAGRVPTDKGYRTYVDRYLAARRFLEAPEPRQLRERVDRQLQRSLGTHALGKVLAGLLSELTTGIGVILGPAWDGIRALRLDLYPKEGRRVLMVLVLENALVRSGVFLPEREYSAAVVAEAARILSERISGRTVAEIRTRVLPTLDVASPAGRCASDLAAQGRDLFADVEEGGVELDGVSSVLRQQEFSEPTTLKSLVLLLESPRLLRDALRRLSPERLGALAVWIGSENPVHELRPFSLLAAPFQVGGRRGVLAVLGPRRMPYARAVSGMDVLLRRLASLN